MNGGIFFHRGTGTSALEHFAGDQLGPTSVAIETWSAGVRSDTIVIDERGALVRWVEGRDPLSGERRGPLRRPGGYRPPLRFVWFVINNPKSLSIVASQNPVVAGALDRTLARQADAVAGYLSSVAVTRIGPKGTQRKVGGLSVELARVSRLTSRSGDPYRHINLMVNSRVRIPDGTWHALDTASIRQHIHAVHECGEQILLSDAGLRQVLASEGYSLGADGEIDQARSAVELCSKRSVHIAATRARLEARWRGKHPGEEPSKRVRHGWGHQAWREGRPGKPAERESPEQRFERLRVELGAAGFDFTPGARTPLLGDRVLELRSPRSNTSQPTGS